MPELRPGAKAAMGFFGVILRSATEGESTAEMWNSIRRHAEENGLDLSGSSAIDIGQLRGIANDIVRSSQAIASAEPERAVSMDMIAEAPWARSPSEAALNPEYQVRFLHTFVDEEGQTQQAYRTAIFQGGLPVTVGQLQDMIEGEAMAMAADYEVTHAGIGSVQILSV